MSAAVSDSADLCPSPAVDRKAAAHEESASEAETTACAFSAAAAEAPNYLPVKDTPHSRLHCSPDIRHENNEV